MTMQFRQWRRVSKKDLKLVKRMQRHATRCVKGLRGLQYPARLREVQLPSMQSQILRSTLMTAYNLFQGNLNLPLEELFDAPAVGNLCGHQFKVPATSIPTSPTASSIRSSSGRAVEQTAPLPRRSAIAKCVQGETRQPLGDHFLRFFLVPCKFIFYCTWFWPASAIFFTSKL